jgi:acetyl esterase/lipase
MLRAADDDERPTEEELARGGTFSIMERIASGVGEGPAVSLLICRPAVGRGPLPVLYYIHGGGMVAGTNRDALPTVLDLAEQLGAAVVSVEYRRAPEAPHPAPVEDCYAGVAWIAQQAEAEGFDPQRIILIGRSAGGGLAAGVALLARDRHGPHLAGQMLIWPMLDDRNNTPSSIQLAELPPWNRRTNGLGWAALLGRGAGGPAVSEYAAPARAKDLSGLPPTFIEVGSVDLFRDEDVDYASRIWQAGGVAELHVWPGGTHGFDRRTPGARLSRAASSARLSWLNRVLGP